MPSKKFALQALAIASLVVSAGASQAALTVYTSLAAFNAATLQQRTDTFDDLPSFGSIVSPQTRNTGLYTYLASTSESSFFGAGQSTDTWLSSNSAVSSITFDTFLGGPLNSILGIGGNFFGSDTNGAYLLGNVSVTVVDTLGASTTRIIEGATTSSFIGFVSDARIVSLTLSSVAGSAGVGNPIWPTANNLVLAVPEPGTYALMLAGLVAVGAIARRRKA